VEIETGGNEKYGTQTSETIRETNYLFLVVMPSVSTAMRADTMLGRNFK
jgi:hypothetical protein